MAAIDRLRDKLKRAGGAVARQHASIEAQADKIINTEAEVEQKTATSFAPHHAHLAEQLKGLDELQAQLKLLNNEPDTPETPRPLASGGR